MTHGTTETGRPDAGRLEAPRPAAPLPAAAPADVPLPEAPSTRPILGPPEALYVHVPFCVSHCPYCDFVVYAGAAARGPRSRIEPFTRALLCELSLRADALDAVEAADRPPLRSVYLGGGTPSLLAPAAIAALLGAVAHRFGIAPDAEVTIEVNPSPDERGDLAGFVAAGVNRVSIGAQSLDVAELRRLGRRHSPADVGETVAAARHAGVRSVSLDLLYDVPDQSIERWGQTLRESLELRPDHLSLYALTLNDPDAEGLSGEFGDHLPTPPGARRWREHARAGQDDDRAAAQYTLAWEALAGAGWRGYEISNWARQGHESRHNLAYWQRRPYEAIGPGAHAFDGSSRRWNAARLDRYLAALVAPGGRATLPPGGAEPVDEETAAAEEVILGLRLARGIPLEAGRRRPLSALREWAMGAGLLEQADPGEGDGERLRLTLRGRLLSNELFARLV